MLNFADKQMKKRVFSGARPTGRQHIGNYLGAVQNYVALQDEYDCVYCVVDIHALTTLENTESLREDIYEMVLDWLAAGMDPQKAIIFVQSHVPQVEELHTLFSMVTPLSWLLRVPTFKEKVKMQPHNVNYGLVGYPVLMTADIALYKGEVVPVGEDQLPHLEITREIARRFNTLYEEVFPIPEPLLTRFPRLPGLDGKRMSKSMGNVILLSDEPEEIAKKVMTAVTDPEKIKMGDPGHPDICNVFAYHSRFNSDSVGKIEAGCKSGELGCVECKRKCAVAISEYLASIRERRKELQTDEKSILEMLSEGAERARERAQETMNQVRQAMHFSR